tara:strand:- start:362 stop:865 length:504 start_codon:yes stop_codon:yes gene_type:complete
MQLLEYLMWVDQGCSGLNQISTDLGFIHNILQPIVSLLVAYLMINKLPKWVYVPILIYIIYSLPKIWVSKKKNQCSKPCSGENIGLSWEYTNTEQLTLVRLIFTIALCAPFLTMKKNGTIYAGLIMGIYIVAFFISRNRCKGAIIPSNGSWWCLMVTLIPFSEIFIN